ncbi:surfeit locus 1 family protein [Alcanivorax hongdengensis A-11-3]|uniref:SURF1-like protein n=1 Tax=Alcanivorax hongdengensis A-11-3 TaxID=1177179 RepID=L0WFQ7_9GAMM|nr:SURF1 family protein [Alcanivorax hongdengensis]EKF74655.1 surfeit locus 1 family protein [Alcanivorax hongdengensis A-11-3]
MTTKIVATLLAVLAFFGFVALGTWQVERRAWKLDLIARVDQRVHAPAIAAPGPDQWATINRDDNEYQHVRLHGRFLHDKEALVQASSELGAGFWVLTPLRRDDGTTVLINRGFVPPDRRDPAERGSPAPQGPVTVTGLLRLSEPGGGFLRDNDPDHERWYSRDVQAIAADQGLKDRVAPYFVDAEARPGQPWPRGGLTVIHFHNSHLVYAITWYSLALMVAGAFVFVVRDERSRLRNTP